MGTVRASTIGLATLLALGCAQEASEDATEQFGLGECWLHWSIPSLEIHNPDLEAYSIVSQIYAAADGDTRSLVNATKRSTSPLPRDGSSVNGESSKWGDIYPGDELRIQAALYDRDGNILSVEDEYLVGHSVNGADAIVDWADAPMARKEFSVVAYSDDVPQYTATYRVDAGCFWMADAAPAPEAGDRGMCKGSFSFDIFNLRKNNLGIHALQAKLLRQNLDGTEDVAESYRVWQRGPQGQSVPFTSSYDLLDFFDIEIFTEAAVGETFVVELSLLDENDEVIVYDGAPMQARTAPDGTFASLPVVSTGAPMLTHTFYLRDELEGAVFDAYFDLNVACTSLN